MSRDNLTGTFLSGGLSSSTSPIDLPDPNAVTRGTLYRDESGQIWRADRTSNEKRGLIQQWVRVTEVSAVQQRRDRILALVFGVAALAGTFLVFKLVVALSLDIFLGALLVAGTFMACVALSLNALDRVSHQVVLPAETPQEISDRRSSLEAPGRGE
jgi:hypothetical protein